MSVMEFIGGGPPAAPAGGGDPLAALLGGGGPPAPEEQAAPAGGQDEEISTLKELIGLGRAYTDLPTVTEQERLEAEKALTIFQKLLADNERGSDSLLGTSPALRKALAGGP